LVSFGLMLDLDFYRLCAGIGCDDEILFDLVVER
jgi:hypothetical protein